MTRPQVLIVDDSLTVRMDLAEALAAAGFEPRPCADLTSARDALVGREVALVVLDVLLPDGSGLDLLRELKSTEATAAIPVVLLSSEAEVRSRIAGMRAGADDYLGKPYDLGQVVARARALVQRAKPTTEPRRRLLVIDDSATFREELVGRLRDAGYEVHDAATGEDGLALAATILLDAVIVDGVLPGIDGATVVRRLKSDATLRAVPCLLMTAGDSTAEELRALDAGADVHVRKTEDLDVLLVRIAGLLRSQVGHAIEGGASLLGPKRLLAVDDSVTYLHELGEQLRREGYDVVMATSGEEALDLLATQSVDAILMDLVMPGLSGEETCRRIKQAPRWRDIPLVMLTAREDREAMIGGINAGADDFIAKTSDFDVLCARLRAQLRRKHFEDENRRIREQLVRRELARDQAEQESRFKSRFLASMSHELRTPLNAVIGFSELLDQELAGPLNAQQREFVEAVHTSGRHLLELVNDILDLSKIAAGKMELARERTAIRGVVDAMRAMVQPLLEKRGQRLEVSAPPLLPMLWLDPLRVRQILFNLVSNAIKFSTTGATVTLTLERRGGFLAVACRDTGVGIRAEDLPRLFREFEQLDPGPGGRREGTGLGLALTKRLVELHGGEIQVDSVRGAGSTFTFTLPVEDVAP